jgi:hypothetical protein
LGKPELKLVVDRKPEAEVATTAASPEQVEMPFAMVQGEPSQPYRVTFTSRRKPWKFFWRLLKGRSICCCI